MLKVEVYIPEEALTKIQSVIKDYCCVKSNKYTHCMSWHKVQSVWQPIGDAKPYLGTVGQDQYAEEYLLTFRCKEEDLEKVVGLIKENHPYEEVAIDVCSIL